MKNKTLIKALAVFIAVAIILCSAPLSGFVGLKFPELKLPEWLDYSMKAEAASYSGTCGSNLTWSLDTESGELVITGSGAMTDYSSVPWYSYRSYIKSVFLPDGLTSIGDSAFSSCTGLTSVTIPDSVTSIGNWAFYECTSLTRVYYTGDIESWCGITFYGCYANPMYYAVNFYIDNTLVKEVVIPDTVTEIKNYAFYSFEGLTSVTIGNSVTSIGDDAFRSCTSLKSVTIGNSVTSIGYYAFSYCESLTSVTIGNSVTSIGSSAFRGCTSLTSITIGNGVTSIGYYAFYECTSLTRVYYTGDIESWCGITFDGYYANPMYYAANFYIDNTLVKEVVIPDTVTEIKNYAFYSFEGLTSVTIGNSVTSIGDRAFYGCTGLTSVTIGNSVTSIGGSVFEYCTSLTSVTIPDSVTSIGYDAFYYCRSLARVYYTGDIESWCGITFDSYDANPMCYAANFYINGELVENVTIPDGTTAIKSHVFYGFDNIKSVTIPVSVITIHKNAFYDCSSIENVYYKGTDAQWDEIAIYDGNDSLKNSKKTFLNGGHTPDIPETSDTKLSVSVSDISLNYKSTVNINAEIKSSGKYTVEYSSSNESVATVDKNGNVTATGDGTAEITVTVKDANGNTAKDTCKVTVAKAWWQWIIYILLLGFLWY